MDEICIFESISDSHVIRNNQIIGANLFLKRKKNQNPKKTKPMSKK